MSKPLKVALGHSYKAACITFLTNNFFVLSFCIAMHFIRKSEKQNVKFHRTIQITRDNWLQEKVGYRLGSRFRVNETSQTSERYSVQMKAAIKQKKFMMLSQMYFSMIEYPKFDWYSAFGHKRLCCSRATAGTFILNLFHCC